MDSSNSVRNSFSFSQMVFRNASEILDTHCHYNLEPIFSSWERQWQMAREHGVIQSIIPGVDLETSLRAVEISRQQGDGTLRALVGVHPGSVRELGSQVPLETVLHRLEELLSHTEVVGVGEIGLDYFRLSSENEPEREQQRQWLRAQLELAQRFSAPVALHVRDKEWPEEPTRGNAYWDVLSLLQECHFSQETVLHCVSGPRKYVQNMIDRGAYVSFAANITYPSAQPIRDLLAFVPRSKILCETDAPYLPPQEFRGKTCEPWMIQETAEVMQKLLEEKENDSDPGVSPAESGITG